MTPDSVVRVAGPAITSIGSIYRIQWPEDFLDFRVERIHEDSKGVTTAEIHIFYNGQANLVIQEYERLNLTSAQAKAKLAKICEERAPIGVNWGQRIEKVCREVIQLHRQGEPIINLAEMKASERLRWRVEPLLYDKQANLIYGEGGLGKSILANYLGVLVASGQQTPELPNVEPGNVLYLDYETSPDEILERTSKLTEGLILANMPQIHYRFCSQPLAHDIEYLQREVLQRDISLIIVDSVGPACGGEPENAAATIECFRALRPLKVTALLVAHVAKNSHSKTPFGSVYWWNLSRSVWEVVKGDQSSDGSTEIGLWHRKVNNGRLLPPRAYRVRFSDEDITFHDIRPQDSDTLKESLRNYEQIALALKDGGKNLAQIVETTGLKESAVKTELSKNKRRFVKLGSGLWGNRAEEKLELER